jgi:hypothetical protein
MSLDYFEPIAGDDRPLWTLHYRDVPTPFRLADAWLVLTDTLPLLQSRKDGIITAFDLHYGRYEINADTYQDFLDLLKETLLINADTMERLLEVYDSDIAKPILGREETRTLTIEEEGIADASTENIDVPADNPLDDKPTSKGKSGQTSNVVRDEIETTTLSDLGVRPNYESLNGFLDNNRTLYTVFNNFFKDCFIMAVGWYVQ